VVEQKPGNSVYTGNSRDVGPARTARPAALRTVDTDAGSLYQRREA
jgi:hypothetical protein